MLIIIKRLSKNTIVSFTLALILCMVMIFIVVVNKINVEQMTMEQVIMEKSNKANEVLSRLLYKTQTISVLVTDDYSPEVFQQVAATIVDDPAILNILVAPGGVVTDVYPLKGNEAVIGLDFLEEGEGNKEALLAMETGGLVMGGPFNAVQGGQVIVGRLPVYKDGPDGNKEFWGLVSVTLKYPQVLDGAGLNELRLRGFDYEISRINPDDGKKQIISGSGYTERWSSFYVERNVPMQNAEWVFRIYPLKNWYEHTDVWLMLTGALCISGLIAFVMQNNVDLKVLKTRYENMSQTDPMTNVFNKRYFTECALTQLERISRQNHEAFFIMFDVDNFKGINDTYGHLYGDALLKYMVSTVKGLIRPYDLLCRFGGDEFIILVLDSNKSGAMNLTERIRASVENGGFEHEGVKANITASFGIARAGSPKDFESAVNHADTALYIAKRNGKNQYHFYEENDEQSSADSF